MSLADRERFARQTGFKFLRIFSLGLFAILILSGCDQSVREHRETIYIFGTLVEFIILDADPGDARMAVAKVDQEFQRMQKDWHAWKPGELTRINDAISQGKPIKASPFLLPLIGQAKILAAQSDNLFNPAIGALINAWGFHADERPERAPPAATLIQNLVSRQPAMADVTINGDQVSSTNPAVQFDFGGFAKGVALDRAVSMLRDLGFANAIVNAGGDMNIMGSAGTRPWSVGIRHPVDRGLIASIDLGDNENLYTSGNYFRYLEHEGVKYSHIIDPRTGMPVRHIVSVSVIHTEGAVADAAATALSVAGPDDWHRIARQMGIKLALLIDDRGTVYADPNMLKRIEFVEGEPPNLIVSDPL